MIALIISMFTFSLSMSISPGPVNLTILNSSMNYGLKATLPFVTGATLGFTLLLAAVCLGLYQLLVIFPILLDVITLFGTVLLVWMGWKIFRADGERIVNSQTSVQAPTFLQGGLMQWFNPKAWIAAFAGTELFSTSNSGLLLVIFVLIYFVVCYGSLLIWSVAGHKLAHFLNRGQRTKYLNMIMGIMLIGISIEMCWQHFVVH